MIGLMAQEEALKKHGKGNLLTLTGCKDLSGKHPVSGLLELCTRRRWGPPSFSQVRKQSFMRLKYLNKILFRKY